MYSIEQIEVDIVEVTKVLGYSELRQHQRNIVEHFLNGLVSLPTGSGKSLFYCLFPKAFDLLRGSKSVDTQSVVIVVSPLIALIKD